MIPAKMRKWIVTVLATAALILTFSLTATAATYNLELGNNLWLTNDYQVDTLYLYISDGPVTFDSLVSAPGDWSLAAPITPDRMVISGTAIDPGTGLPGSTGPGRAASARHEGRSDRAGGRRKAGNRGSAGPRRPPRPCVGDEPSASWERI